MPPRGFWRTAVGPVLEAGFRDRIAAVAAEHSSANSPRRRTRSATAATSTCWPERERVVVVGGGFLGLEAAYGLAKAGAPVSARALDGPLDGAPAGGAVLKRLVQDEMDGPVERQHESDLRRECSRRDRAGRRLSVSAADAVIFAQAFVPTPRSRKQPASAVIAASSSTTPAGNEHRRRLCARRMRRARRRLLRPGPRPAYEQAKVLAESLAGPSTGSWSLSTNLKVSGESM